MLRRDHPVDVVRLRIFFGLARIGFRRVRLMVSLRAWFRRLPLRFVSLAEAPIDRETLFLFWVDAGTMRLREQGA